MGRTLPSFVFFLFFHFYYSSFFFFPKLSCCSFRVCWRLIDGLVRQSIGKATGWLSLAFQVVLARSKGFICLYRCGHNYMFFSEVPLSFDFTHYFPLLVSSSYSTYTNAYSSCFLCQLYSFLCELFFCVIWRWLLVVGKLL